MLCSPEVYDELQLGVHRKVLLGVGFRAYLGVCLSVIKQHTGQDAWR
jgi:hypothetical protein